MKTINDNLLSFKMSLNKKRVVVTLTTLPDRYDLLRKTLNSILEQDYKVDCIYLTLPNKAKRLNKEYPNLPEDIASKCKVIRIEEDYGPVTKVYGGIISEKDPNTIIISCDDDVIYSKNCISSLLRRSEEYPNHCICGTGALLKKGVVFMGIHSSLIELKNVTFVFAPYIDENGRDMDLIFGVAGVLYKRSFFPDNDNLYNEMLKYSNNKYLFLNDDILISAYLNKKGIKMRIFRDIAKVTCQVYGRKDALSYDFLPMLDKMGKALDYVKSEGFYQTMEHVTIDETLLGKVLILLLVIIILIILCILILPK